MKSEKIKVLKKGTLFILIGLLLLYAINSFYEQNILSKKEIYRKEVAYNGYIKELDSKEINYSFFGDSHTNNAINPEYIPGSYNFASNHENYVKTYFKIRKIVTIDNISLKTIILPLDLHTFSTFETDSATVLNNLWLFTDFVSYNEISEIRKISPIRIWIESNLPVIGSGMEFSILLSEHELKPLPGGWSEFDRNFSSSDIYSESLAQYNQHFKGQKRISKLSLDYFLNTLQFAKLKNISIVFIMYPVSKEYDSVIVEKGVKKKEYYDVIFESVNNTIGNDYNVLDYYGLFFEYTEYFANPDHLNSVGSEKLSRRVYEDLLKIRN